MGDASEHTPSTDNPSTEQTEVVGDDEAQRHEALSELLTDIQKRTSRRHHGLVNDRDCDIDVTAEELIKGQEDKFGEIKVTGVGATSDLSEPATEVLPQEQTNEIVVNLRNQKIANEIQSRDDEKIVLLFGAAHGPGVIEALQQADPNWQRTK